MSKKLLTLFIISILVLNKSYCQAPLGAANPNFVHDKITDFYTKSVEVKLPDSVYTILKNYARNKNYNEFSVLRNDYVFKVLYNKNISIGDRLYACNFFIKSNITETYSYVPIYFLKALQLDLIAKK